MEGDPDDYRIEMSVTAKTNGVTVTVAASNFTNRAWCDLVTSNGTWRASWDMVRDHAAFVDTNATFDVKLVYAPVAWSEANYMIIDLSSGTGSKNYPARLVREIAPDPAMFNISAYKTDRLVMRRVKACTFKSGSAGTETTISNDYFVGVFPLTIGQYRKIYGSWTIPADVGDDFGLHRPVGGLWHDAGYQYIIDRLKDRVTVRSQGGLSITLPSRIMRECACRAGTETAYYWGSSTSGYLDYGWFGANSGNRTHAVGGKLPNAWGLYDMVGNIWEWTYEARDSSNRYMCGASYMTSASSLHEVTSYYTWYYPPYTARGDMGIRVYMIVE